MRKIFLAVVAAMMIAMSASFALAHNNLEQDVVVTTGDNNIDTRVNNDLTANGGRVDLKIGDTSATGGNANQQQDQRQKQLQKQKQYQRQYQYSNSGGNVYKAAKNWTTAPLLSAFVNAPTSEVPKGWKQIICDPSYYSFTVRQLKNMAGGTSIFNARLNGLSALFAKRVIPSIRFEAKREINDDTIITIINRPLGFGEGKQSGSAEGRGIHDGPVDQILAETLLELIYETHSVSYIVHWDVIAERVSSASTIGVGGGSSQSNGSASSVSVGASSSTASTLTKITYMIQAKAYEEVIPNAFVCGEMPRTEVPAPEFETPEAPAPEPEKVAPEPQACNPDEFLRKLKKAEDEIFVCRLYSHNNLFWQLEAMKASLDIYLCTGNATYLEDAIQHGQMAELNYIHGKDIGKYANSGKLIGEVEYLLASAFYARDNSIKNYWKAPASVVHVDKKRGNAKPTALTPYEKKRVEKIRCTLERYSKKLAL